MAMQEDTEMELTDFDVKEPEIEAENESSEELEIQSQEEDESVVRLLKKKFLEIKNQREVIWR